MAFNLLTPPNELNIVDPDELNLEPHAEPKKFPNVGWLECDTPQWIRDIIMEDVKDPGDDFRGRLAGHTQGARSMPRLKANNDYELWLSNLVRDYHAAFPSYLETLGHFKDEMQIRLSEVWVNYHYKHDFNPMHYHTGVFSYVTWIRIPYKREDEAKQFITREPQAGQFLFTYINAMGEVCDQWVEQREWTTLFFPSRMRHKVHPFYTSDDVRITMSGNLMMVNK